jgi:hypothetical protein
MSRRLSATAAETDIVQTGERVSVSWDFAAELVGAEVITSKTLSCFNSAGTDVTSTVVLSSLITTGTVSSLILIQMSACVDNEMYNFKMVATISSAKILQADLFVPVRNVGPA